MEKPFRAAEAADFNALVDQAAHFVAAQRGDHALDVPPVAEAHDIALVTAALGPRRRLVAGIVAEAFHQLRRIGERQTSVDEGRVHARALNRAAVSRLRTRKVNEAST